MASLFNNESLEKELKHYQQIVDEVKKLKSLTETLDARKKTIENLMKSRLSYPKFMEDLLSILPGAIYLNSLNTTDIPNGYALTLSCISYDNFAIADFISNLETSKKFTNIELSGIRSSGIGPAGMESFSFEIKCNYTS